MEFIAGMDHTARRNEVAPFHNRHVCDRRSMRPTADSWKCMEFLRVMGSWKIIQKGAK